MSFILRRYLYNLPNTQISYCIILDFQLKIFTLNNYHHTLRSLVILARRVRLAKQVLLVQKENKDQLDLAVLQENKANRVRMV